MSTSAAYDRRAVWSWAFYDFANSAFTTLIVTFIYATYFTSQLAEDSGDLWSQGVVISSIFIALLSPFMGAIADRGGYRRRFLLISTVVCILGSVALFFPTKGDVYWALGIFVITNIAYEMGLVFYNAFLPDIAPASKIGRISGYGWGLGYAGGLICLILALVLFVQPDNPLFGLLTKDDAVHVRATNILVAVWFALFAIPQFLYVPERKVENVPKMGVLIRSAASQIVTTFHDLRRYRQTFRLLVARLIYNDGLVTIFSLGGIYAQGTFGFTTEDIILFGIALNVAAGFGAWLFGFMDDRAGGKATIMVSLIGLLAATLIAVFTTSRFWFWVSAVCVGLLAGPNQSASRSLLGRFVPKAKENEFYGFFAFSGKATAFLGPLLFYQLLQIFDGVQRYGIAVVAAFFVIGAVLLLRVNEQEGIAAAQAPVES